MSTLLPPTDSGGEPVTFDDLVGYFHAGAKPRDRWRIGAEFEKFALDRRTGRQIGFDGPDGIESILVSLVDRFGWTPHHEAGRLTTLSRAGATVSVEPGGQVELSTPPADHVSAVRDELDRHLRELRAVTDPDRVAWVGIGFTPFSRVEDIPLNPRPRHRLMAEYLPARCRRGLDMMKATASTQAAFDFADEADAMRKLRVGLTLGPVVNAVFANSPLETGRPAGVVSVRGQVWQGMDPDRCGHLPDLLVGEMSFERYADHALDVPMLFVADGESLRPSDGSTFRHFLERGRNGRRPTLRDWELHLSTIFTEMRLKQFLEVRGADATSAELAACVPAVWAGVLYDDVAIDAAETMADEFEPHGLDELACLISLQGLDAECRGRSVREWAKQVFDIAAAGLVRSESFEDSCALNPAFERLARRTGVTLPEGMPPPAVVAAFEM